MAVHFEIPTGKMYDAHPAVEALEEIAMPKATISTLSLVGFMAEARRQAMKKDEEEDVHHGEQTDRDR